MWSRSFRIFQLRVQELLCSEARVLRGSEPSGCAEPMLVVLTTVSTLSRKSDDKVVHGKGISTLDPYMPTNMTNHREYMRIRAYSMLDLKFSEGKFALYQSTNTSLGTTCHHPPAVERRRTAWILGTEKKGLQQHDLETFQGPHLILKTIETLKNHRKIGMELGNVPIYETHMLHGAEIFAYIDTPKLSSFVSKYPSTMEHLGTGTTVSNRTIRLIPTSSDFRSVKSWDVPWWY